jgi:hypothetical protein
MSTADDIKRLIRTPHVNSQVDTLADALQSERDALLEALKDVLDSLGALSKPHELQHYMGEDAHKVFEAIKASEGKAA